MSTSSRSDHERQNPWLNVDGPPGVEIQIVDGAYHVVARGASKLNVQLPQGVYIVRWLGFDRSAEEIVRLLPIKRPLHLKAPDSLKEVAPSASIHADTMSESALMTLAPSQRPHDSDIVIFEQSRDLDGSENLSRGLRLFNNDDVAMRSDGGAVEAAAQTSDDVIGWALRVYHVPPGNYRLRYYASSGETLDQSVVAIANRRTFVFLNQAEAQTLVADGDVYTRVKSRGVDPIKTVVLSAPLAGPTQPDPASVRRAEVLLHALAADEGPLDRRMLREVEARDADPLVRLYAAVLILERLGRKVSPGLDDPYPSRANKEFSRLEQVFLGRWRKEAKKLVSNIGSGFPLPDVVACRWHLAGETAGAIINVSITAPPMLDPCWQWAVEHGAVFAGSIADGPSIRGATRGRVAASPWLVWRASAAKEVVIGLGTEPTRIRPLDGLVESPRLSEAVERLAGAINQTNLRERVGSERSGTSDNDPLRELSAEGRNVALAALASGVDIHKPFDPATIRKLASLLLAPPRELEERLRHTADELGQFAVREGQSDTTATTPQQHTSPPALRRRIKDFDDPNKGRFGGLARAGGFDVTVSFAPTNDTGWVLVHLKVQADDSVVLLDGERASYSCTTHSIPRVRTCCFQAGTRN